ncbi:MAG: hypothetical protein EA424_16430 [Planctomycetaceae bacterium]|nr:MAG: hypothetical protein EA424_16430 [Planctomycetaceae bacterium]
MENQVIEKLQATQRAVEADDLNQARQAACQLLQERMDDVPTLGIDLDGTIDETPAFFQVLTKTWPGRVVIITARGCAWRWKSWSSGSEAHADGNLVAA